MIKITTYGGIPNVEQGTGGRWMGGGGVASLIILLLITYSFYITITEAKKCMHAFTFLGTKSSVSGIDIEGRQYLLACKQTLHYEHTGRV